MPYAAYDLDDLTRLMEDRWDSTPFWDEVEAKNALNEALLVWNTLTGFWKTRDTSLSTVIGQSIYELPSTICFGFRVELNSVQLTPTSTFELDNAKPGWEADTGTPRFWLPIDLSTIQLYPVPTIYDVTITVDGIAATPQLLYDTDNVQLGSDALHVIVGYALHAVALKEGGARFDSTMKYFNEFLNAAAELNNQLTKSAMFRQFLGLDIKREEQPTR